ncbi:alpha/beta-hydrolase [Thozetella sp. PMI_491]|nr:alpha/beta-hydrolase [Thozetella sp. PMI_491]
MTAPAPDKPVVVIVHGAWHRPLHYLTLVLQLQAAGYTTVVPELPFAGWGPDVVKSTTDDSIEAVKAALKPFLDMGKEVIVVGHSFGGIPAAQAVAGETVEDRKARGEAGGVKAIVFLAAYANPAADMSVLDAVNTGKTPEELTAVPSWWGVQENLAILNEKAKEFLYGDLDEQLREICFSGTAPQSFAAWLGTCRHSTTDLPLPKVYVACKRDQALPYHQQLVIAEAIKAKTIHLDTSHSPFVKVENAAKIVEAIDEVIV